MDKEKVFVESFGWRKVKGFRINLDSLRDLNDNWIYYYLLKEDLGDYVEKVSFWSHDDYEVECFEDINQLIEFIEEDEGVNFDDYFKKH